MYAQISTWRRRPQDLDQIRRDLAPISAKMRQQPGYVAGYGVNTAPDTTVVVTVWESEQAFEAAFAAIKGLIEEIVGGRMELIDRKRGPAWVAGTAAPS